MGNGALFANCCMPTFPVSISKDLFYFFFQIFHLWCLYVQYYLILRKSKVVDFHSFKVWTLSFLGHLLPFWLGNEISKLYMLSCSFQTQWAHLCWMQLYFEELLLPTEENKQQISNDLFCLLGFSVWKHLLYGNNESGNVRGIISGLWMMLSSFYSILMRNQMTYEAFKKCIGTSLMLWTSWGAVTHI